jgi:hypothetical protein
VAFSQSKQCLERCFRRGLAERLGPFDPHTPVRLGLEGVTQSFHSAAPAVGDEPQPRLDSTARIARLQLTHEARQAWIEIEPHQYAALWIDANQFG